jgi:coatomer protein complex subunit alpha (xenin)
VVFVPQIDAIMAVSEDRTLRAWENSRRQQMAGSFPIRREADRFWVVAAHPTANLVAAGHDNGFVLYKLGRERAMGAMHETSLFYIKDRVLRMYDTATERDTMVGLLRRPSVRSFALSPVERLVLTYTDQDHGVAETFVIPREGSASEPRKIPCKSAVIAGRNRIYTLASGTVRSPPARAGRCARC